MTQPMHGRPMRTVHEVGNEIRRHRQAAGITQQSLADRAGVSRRWINQIERGHLRAELDKLMRVTRALGFTLRFDTPPRHDSRA